MQQGGSGWALYCKSEAAAPHYLVCALCVLAVSNYSLGMQSSLCAVLVEQVQGYAAWCCAC